MLMETLPTTRQIRHSLRLDRFESRATAHAAPPYREDVWLKHGQQADRVDV